jgi:hypothetical protein
MQAAATEETRLSISRAHLPKVKVLAAAAAVDISQSLPAPRSGILQAAITAQQILQALLSFLRTVPHVVLPEQTMHSF